MPLARELSLEQFAAFLARRADDLARLDLTVPLKECALIIKAATSENFQGSHDPDGVPWKPLKRPRSGKRHKGSTPKPLLDTGLLRASVSANGKDHIETVTDSALEVGTSLHYAIYHNEGTATIPQREFLGFSQQVLTDIEEVLADYLEANLL